MSDEKKGINALATGVAGAVIGAAAAAAAIALSDEKNRKKAEKILSDMQSEGNKIFKEISKMALELRDKGTKALPKANPEPKKRIAKGK
ncbi:MAG: hypothetical protein Q8Q91_01980 [Candidatus Daviesbacteria bacterium]|nr:hypothetical protein [Candidatus Daviesbacteria bacterium]